MNLDPGGLVAWLVVGLIAGWLAGQFMQRSGYGLVGDILLGVVGAPVGGLYSSLQPDGGIGFFGSILVALVGAVSLVALVRAVPGRSAA
jgi:uncharacterized membrane protein YeaQ/YmgE (transglycosylase-associated protein family)